MNFVPFLDHQASLEPKIGVADCATLIADWVLLHTGVDPLQDRRGYRTIGEMGSLPITASRLLRRSGLRMKRLASVGDVAVLAFPIYDGALLSCGLRTQNHWAVRLEDGISLFKPDQIRVLAAWGVPCLRQ